MKKNTGYVVLVLAVAFAVGATNLHAEDGFMKRLNPFRFFRSRTEVKASTQAQLEPGSERMERRGIHPLSQNDAIARETAAAQDEQYRARFGEDATPLQPGNTGRWQARLESRNADPATIRQQAARGEQAHLNGGPLSERTAEGQPPTLEELRAHLESRGIDPARIEARIQHTTAARENGHRYGQAGKYGESPSLEQMRAELEARGMDPAAIDAQIARRSELRQREGRFVRQAHGITAPDNDQVRTRLERGGLAPDEVSARLGRLPGNAGNGPDDSHNARGGLGRIRR